MDRDVQDSMMQVALAKILDGTLIYPELESKFLKNPESDSPFLALWFMSKLIDKRIYCRGEQELSEYRKDFYRYLSSEQDRRTRNNRENEPPFSEATLEKMRWVMDIFLMDMGSTYIENL